MRWSLQLPTLALLALAGCSGSSDALGPSTDGMTSDTPSQQSASNPAVTDSASHRALDTTARAAMAHGAMAHASPTLQLVGRAVARCESQLAPRVFVNDSAALEPAMSPAVTRVLAGRVRLRLPALLEFGARCPTTK